MNELEVQEVGYKFFHEYRGRLIGFLSHIRHGHIVFQDAEETIPIGRIDAVYNIVNKLIAQAKE
jgi:hypothetical protein